jgi:C-terminal processing protease CtpA/Prc
MNGGQEYGEPLYVIKVNPQSVAAKAGMRAGDGILQIGQTPTRYMSHEQAKMEIIRAGNEVDFIVQRGAVPLEMVQPPPRLVPQHSDVRVVKEEMTWKAQNPQVQSRSFKILQAQMEAE